MILFLNGSSRKRGITTTLLRAMAEAVGEHHEVEWVDVNDLSIRPCIGCLACRPDKRCVLPRDDGQRIGELIAAAHAVVVGSPCYWGNMTGPLKLLFDRNVPTFEFIDGSLLKPMQKGKRAIIVVASNAPAPFHLMSSQSRGTVRALKTVLGSAGYRVRALNVPNGRQFEGTRDRWIKCAKALATTL